MCPVSTMAWCAVCVFAYCTSMSCCVLYFPSLIVIISVMDIMQEPVGQVVSGT